MEDLGCKLRLTEESKEENGEVEEEEGEDSAEKGEEGESEGRLEMKEDGGIQELKIHGKKVGTLSEP